MHIRRKSLHARKIERVERTGRAVWPCEQGREYGVVNINVNCRCEVDDLVPTNRQVALRHRNACGGYPYFVHSQESTTSQQADEVCRHAGVSNKVDWPWC